MERGRNTRAPGALRRYPPRATPAARRPSPAGGGPSRSEAHWPAQEHGELSAEEELKIAFGRAIGFVVAAIVLVVGGGLITFVVAALFFGFLFGQ